MEEDQEAGRALVGAFKAALPLRGLPRQQFVAAHRARLVVEAAASGQAGAAARARLAALDAAEVRFNSLGESLPTPWQLEEKQVVGRFFSFVRREEHGHETKLPKRKPRLTPFAVGELLGIAPYASPHTRLFWHSRQQRVVTALDGRSIVHNEHGTRVMSADGEFISLMLPVAEWLQGAELLNHEKDVTEWLLDDVSDNLPRGEAHTACYTKFGGGLLKMDTYGATTAMPHSRISQSKFNQERFNRASDRIRALGQKVYKKAMKYIYSEFAVLSEVLHANGVHLALSGHGSITSGTGGQNFWNVVHTDSDLGLTILVAFGAVSGGGEFVHPQVGVAHDVRPGCIMVVNPKHAHATAEFQLAAGEHRRMVAFFTKEAVVCGAGTAMAAAHRRGLEVWVPGKRSRKQK